MLHILFWVNHIMQAMSQTKIV